MTSINATIAFEIATAKRGGLAEVNDTMIEKRATALTAKRTESPTQMRNVVLIRSWTYTCRGQMGGGEHVEPSATTPAGSRSTLERGVGVICGADIDPDSSASAEAWLDMPSTAGAERLTMRTG